jgi:glycosyltransferase involved in cell wall biosynthesis
VRHGVEGLIGPPADAEALADALEKLARDPEMRRRLGLAARARLLDGYTEADVRAGLARIYRSFLASTHP